MTPNEIYDLPAVAAINFHYVDRDLLTEVFGIEGLRNFDPVEYLGYDEVTQLMLLQKLSFRSSSERQVVLSVLEFGGVPFAVASSGSTALHDVRVTNAEVFEAARDWVIVQMNAYAFKPLIVDPDMDVRLNLHGAAIAALGGHVRLLSPLHVGLHSGAAIFDYEAVMRRFKNEIAPLNDARHFEMGVVSPEIGDKAVDIILSSAIADRTVVVGERVNDCLWLAGFFLADGEAYAAVVGVAGVPLGPQWEDKVSISRVGFAPMFDLIEDFHAHARVDMSSRAATDYAAAFGLTEIEASMAIGRTAQTGHDFLTAAVAEIHRRPEMGPKGPHSGPVWTQARLLSETPALARYGLGMTASLGHARQLHNRWIEVQSADKERGGFNP